MMAGECDKCNKDMTRYGETVWSLYGGYFTYDGQYILRGSEGYLCSKCLKKIANRVNRVKKCR